MSLPPPVKQHIQLETTTRDHLLKSLNVDLAVLHLSVLIITACSEIDLKLVVIHTETTKCFSVLAEVFWI